MAQRGPGILVLPTHGPLLVRCLTFKRDRTKDKAGYIGITGKFVREGASSALVSSASLANLVFAAADNVLPAIAAFARSAIVALNQPDFVVEAAVAGLQDGASTLEAIRTSQPIDTDTSSAQRVAIQAIFDTAGDAITRATGVDGGAVASLVTVARALADGMEGATAVSAFEPAIDGLAYDPATQFSTASDQTADANRAATYLAARLAVITAYSEAIVSAKLSDRNTAITLRANAAEHFEVVLDSLPVSEGQLYSAVMDLRSRVVEYLSRAIANLAPVVIVDANRRMPSLYWAHRLYRDPTRSAELVARNRVAHPSFMPTEFEALAR
jgi:prophage DNA circulation protein